jgi:tetratricopeptide (TPR) repeat protein
MGRANAEEILVVSRTAARPIGILKMDDVLDAYRSPAMSADTTAKAALVPTVTAITIATVLIVSGLVFWQRSRQVQLGHDEYASGQRLLARGDVDDAVAAFRNALAHAPADIRARGALGLALLEGGHPIEASSYLADVARIQPRNGPARAGLADIALASGRRTDALDLYRQALALEWPEADESRRHLTQLAYASALKEAGRRSEAITVLQSVIEQTASDPLIAKEAAATISSIGTPEQAETAYAAVVLHFPGDPVGWHKLGDIRYSRNQDASALEAYQNAVKADPEDDARVSVQNLEEILRLDPTRPHLSIRDRADRWDLVLRRIAAKEGSCATPEEVNRVAAMLTRQAVRVDAVDKKAEAAREVWQRIALSCRTDSVLGHLMGKVGNQATR